MMPSNFITTLRCVVCGRDYPAKAIYTCPACGEGGILDVQYDYATIVTQLTRDILTQRQREIWRYRELLPVDPETARPHLQTGWTPIYNAPALAQEIGIEEVFVKDEGRNPTGSFKDRASAIGVVKAKEFGYEEIACASAGNAAASMAGMAAAVGLRSFIFVPGRTPEPKLAQLLAFGATVFKVNGSYDQAYDLCMQACAQFGWYNRNSAINAYLVEGKKTAGLEIAEQMADNVPDWISVAVGDGCTLAGIWKGLQEMQQLGFIQKLPRMLGVQAEGAAPLVSAFKEQRAPEFIQATTVADSICVGRPRNWRKALAALRASEGRMIAVSDDEILTAQRLLGGKAAVFAEPSGAAALAGLQKAIAYGEVSKSSRALAVITGNGLKDVQSALRATGKAHAIDANLESLLKVVTEKACG
ncbi:MAG: threonine synthase [bacterium]